MIARLRADRRAVATAAVVVVVVAGFALVVLGARSDTTRFTHAPAPTLTAPPVAARTVPPDAGTPSPPRQTPNAVAGALGSVLAVLILVVAAAGVVIMFMTFTTQYWYRGRRSGRRIRAGNVVPDEPFEELAGAVDEGLRRIAEGAPGDAVVACWMRLEEAAARAGTARRPSETAGELTARVLAEHRVSGETLRGLADLYREARYSGHPVGEDGRDLARRALERVRAELGARSSRPGESP